MTYEEADRIAQDIFDVVVSGCPKDGRPAIMAGLVGRLFAAHKGALAFAQERGHDETVKAMNIMFEAGRKAVDDQLRSDDYEMWKKNLR